MVRYVMESFRSPRFRTEEDRFGWSKEQRGSCKWTDPGVLETEHFKGYLFYELDELHYKPKSKKIEEYFTRTREMSDEEWNKRLSEKKMELAELLKKLEDFWHYEVMGWRKP